MPNEFPITHRKNTGGVDVSKDKFHKPINMKDYPFAKMNPDDETDPRLKKYICMVGKCSGVIDEKPE